MWHIKQGFFLYFNLCLNKKSEKENRTVILFGGSLTEAAGPINVL